MVDDAMLASPPGHIFWDSHLIDGKIPFRYTLDANANILLEEMLFLDLD